jgi:hypothetical protein
MIGIVTGTAALVGATLGWWGAVIVALLTLLALAIGRTRPPWANCAVAIVAVVLGAWRAETDAPPSRLSPILGTDRLILVCRPASA